MKKSDSNYIFFNKIYGWNQIYFRRGLYTGNYGRKYYVCKNGIL